MTFVNKKQLSSTGKKIETDFPKHNFFFFFLFFKHEWKRLKRLFYNIRIRIAIIRLLSECFILWLCFGCVQFTHLKSALFTQDSKTRSVKFLNKINAGFSIQFHLGTQSFNRTTCADMKYRDHGGAVVTHSPPTSKVGSSNPGLYVGKLVVAYRWSAVYS